MERNWTENPSILILEDQLVFQDILLGAATNTFENVQSFHQAETLDQARTIISEHVIDLALIDISLPDGHGLELLPLLRQEPHNAYCVMITDHDHVEWVIQCLKKGAQGYILKEDAAHLITDHLHGILDGKPPLSNRVSQKILDYFYQHKSLEHTLTPREQEVLRLLAKGFNRPEIAEILSLSPHTVADHVKYIYQKLDVSSRAEATKAAIELGLN